jgi:hypothetical protein
MSRPFVIRDEGDLVILELNTTDPLALALIAKLREEWADRWHFLNKHAERIAELEAEVEVLENEIDALERE